MGNYTVTLDVCLTNYPTICSTKSWTLEVLACIVTSVTKSGGSVASFTHTAYVSPMNTITFPTYTQVPNCGYTITRTAYISPTTAIPYFMSQDGSKITTLSTNLADSGTSSTVYSMVLVATMTGFTDSSVTWTATITNPCQSTVLSWPITLSAMTNSVLGPTVLQLFEEPTDNISTTYDTTLNHYTLTAGAYSGPFAGATLCGQRTYTVSPATCTAFLTVTDNGGNANQPVLSVYASSVSQATGTFSCTITSSLTTYSKTTTKTVSVTLTACVVTSFTLDTAVSPIPTDLKYYTLMGTALTVSFPTYIQSPNC